MPQSDSGSSKHEAVEALLRDHGDFHDCFLHKLVVDYAGCCVQLHLDDLNSGIDRVEVRPGIVIFDDVEWAFCQIPFVGGEVRVEGVSLGSTPNGVAVSFDLTTTEWMDTTDFKVIRLEISARSVRIAE